MNAEQMRRIETALHDSRSEWERRLGAIRSDRRHETTPLDRDLDDQAIQRENDETLDALDARGHEAIAAIEAALTRLADGSFGLCVQCGETIPFERLESQPTAIRCLPCQAARDDAPG